MKYDFDRVINRRDTYSNKYNFESRGLPDDTLSLWVADMDFQAPPCVIDALTAHCRHGIFGYSNTDDKYFDAIHGWFSKRFNWNVEKDWLIKTPGIVTAVHIALRSLTEEGDAVLIQPPVYYPFKAAISKTGRKLVENRLIYENSGYLIDFDDFEEKIRDNNVKLFILCNPHNPVGRVWRRDELVKLGDICLKHGVTVISDEIHQDFIYDGYKHLVFSELSPKYREITVTCTAPSKTFNLAGLQLSNIFIANPQLRERFKAELARSGLGLPGVMGIVACRAAYEGGSEWLEELISYISGNLSFLREFLKSRIPRIKLVEPEGTYLAWLDCRELNLDSRELDEIILHKAKLWLDDGPMFGSGGEGFQRVNITCPRSILNEALIRLEEAVSTV